jgi:transcriptional regulator with XRE-family HTH domain
MTDSDFIRSARETLGYTQKQLAEKVGASTRSVIRWENNGSVPHRIRMLIHMMVEEQVRADLEQARADKAKALAKKKKKQRKTRRP